VVRGGPQVPASDRRTNSRLDSDVCEYQNTILMIFDKQWLEWVHLSCSFVLGGKQVEQPRGRRVGYKPPPLAFQIWKAMVGKVSARQNLL
jgi:hypothetical protein